MRDLVNTVLGPLIVYLAGQWWRWYQRRKFRGRVEARAQKMIADPAIPVSDPTVAAELALLEEQAPTVAHVARAVRESTPPIMRSTTLADPNAEHVITQRLPVGNRPPKKRDP